MSSPETLLRDMFDHAVAAAQPSHCLAPHLPRPPSGRTVVVGAGKAGAAMARALEDLWPASVSGKVVTRYGHAVKTRSIEVVEASHPVPDDAGEGAARDILSSVTGLTGDDLVIVLMSGGASALLSLAAPGLTLADKQAVNAALLRSGATISEMNCVRKHLSAIKGGRLWKAAQPARVVTLAISDVPGDDMSVIGSGPTVPDPTTLADARGVIERYSIALPDAVAAHLIRAENETPKSQDFAASDCRAELIATPNMSIEAAADLARARGYGVEVLGSDLEGEAREVARAHARLAIQSEPGTILLSGGELTVTIKGDGRGGPNAEYALALALALDGARNIWAIACDTDGIDGSEDNAGAVLRPDTLERARAKTLDPAAHLANNDAYGFFSSLGDLVMTGPTLTNVNDFRAILVER